LFTGQPTVNNIDSNDNVTRIVEELKEEAAQRRKRLSALNLSLRNGHSVPRVDGDHTGEGDFEIPELVLELEPLDTNLSQYSLDELLAYDDDEFVYSAYLALLKRRPETSAFENALAGLRSGRLSKLDILVNLSASAEGREKGVTVPGLRLRTFLLNISRLPLLRYITGPLYSFFQLRAKTRDLQRSISQLFVRQKALTSYVNGELTAHLHSVSPLLQEAVRFFDNQKSSQAMIFERLTEVSQHSEDRLNELREQRKQEFKDRNIEIAELRRVYNKYRTQVELTEKDLKREMEHLFRKYQEVRTELVYQSQRLGSLSGGAETPTPLLAPGESSISDARQLDAFFASFDEHFRGDREEVKQRLRSYLPFIEEHSAGKSDAPILDVACGRGEWLELLREENLVASGVDSNAVLVDQCRERGLEVLQADLLDYLASVPASSLGAISAFHIVEHLSIEDLISLLERALIALRPGGLLLLETPNPQNVLVGSCNFYLDPTHRQPLPGPVLKFLVESRGFVIVKTFGLNPSDEKKIAGDSELVERFNEYFYGPMDYAIVAGKV